MDACRLADIKRWCADPESQDEIGYDYARELLDELEQVRTRAATAEATIGRVLDALGSKYVTR